MHWQTPRTAPSCWFFRTPLLAEGTLISGQVRSGPAIKRSITSQSKDGMLLMARGMNAQMIKSQPGEIGKVVKRHDRNSITKGHCQVQAANVSNVGIGQSSANEDD